MNKTVKCECGYEYELEPRDESWDACPDCDLPYKHIRKSKLIRVEDRLPDNENEVIIHSRFYGVTTAQYFDYWCSMTGQPLKDVTHWQPLPFRSAEY